jgi:Ni/Fe-hydrogenase 1 B-type cytochrome subunit
MGRIREVHFIFAYALTVSMLLRVYWFFLGNNFARSGFPFVWRASWWKAIFGQLLEYTSVKRVPIRLGYNALQGASYTAVIAIGFFQMLTGFALYSQVNPGGFWNRLTGWVIPLLGGPFQTHTWHHLATWGFVLFAIFHIYVVIYTSQLYGNGLVDAMVSGFKFYGKGDVDSEQRIG